MQGGNTDFRGKRVVVKFRHGEITIGGLRLIGTVTEVIKEKDGAFFLHLDENLHLGLNYKTEDLLVIGIEMNPINELFGQSKRPLGLPVLVSLWRVKDEEARNRVILEPKPPPGEFLGRGEVFEAVSDRSPEVVKWFDGVKIPIGQKLESSDKDFLEIFNEVFGFHDARVISNELSLEHRSIDLLLDYIARWDVEDGHIDLKRRRMQISFRDISSIEFNWDDPKLGCLHQIRENLNLIDVLDRHRKSIGKIKKRFHSDLCGAELDMIRARRYDSRNLEFDLVWNTAPKPGLVDFSKVVCSGMSLHFVSDVSVKK